MKCRTGCGGVWGIVLVFFWRSDALLMPEAPITRLAFFSGSCPVYMHCLGSFKGTKAMRRCGGTECFMMTRTDPTGDRPSGDGAARGDLLGGADKMRNAKVAAIKRSFYSSPDVTGPLDERIPKLSEDVVNENELWDSLLGLMPDMPLCRWENVMLPGYNNVLNVWEPMYIHLFEAVMAKPQPWYYVHLHTPTGSDFLNNADYSLDTPNSKAPRVGVLMHVRAGERGPDSCLKLVVQAMTRVRVIKQTQRIKQEVPYSRATVQLLPDHEIAAMHYAAARQLLHPPPRPPPATPAAPVPPAPPAPHASRESWVQTVAHAAAVASEHSWQRFENAFVPLTVTGGVTQTRDLPHFSSISTDAGLEATVAACVASRQEEVMNQAIACLEQRASTADAAAAAAAAREERKEEESGGALLREVEAMEAQVWVQVDMLLACLKRANRSRSIPSAMLGLLPHAPPAGWPADFILEKAATAMSRLELPPRPPPVTECAGQMVATGRQCAFMRVGTLYDPLRRAQKVSYLASSLVGLDQGAAAQALLEAEGVRERLAMLLDSLLLHNRALVDP